MSGRGPGRNTIERLKRTIKLIKDSYPVEVCLSAGILKDASLARELAEAGLDRYNHNLNTSERNYAAIASTHTHADRADTLSAMKQAGISLCSGVIAGMGETAAELIELAFKLNSLQVESIPVNFFIPVPGHAIKNAEPLDAEKCLRILAVFRLINPASELRLAAGRELYLKERLPEAMRLANSLFVSGYLNVKGASADETVQDLQRAGFQIELKSGAYQEGAGANSSAGPGSNLAMKTMQDLRPFA
jgi:biotin synthase